MLAVNNFVAVRKRFYNLSRGSVSQLQNTVGRRNLEYTLF